MSKEKLIKFVYILLCDRLTFGDLEAIITQVNSPDNPETLEMVRLYVEEAVNRLLSSGLRCYNNMCNTQDDDVRLTIEVDSDSPEEKPIPMCADCRRRNPKAVVINQ